MRPLCAAVLGLVVFATAGSAKADDAAKLLGKWEVTKSGGDTTPVGTLVEFAKDNKMTANVIVDGKELKLTGTYKLDGTKLKVNLTLNEQKIDHEFTVKFAGDDELTLEAADKTTETLKKKK